MTTNFPGQRRIHIGLAVTNLSQSREFYETLLGAKPVKERPGYVKFEPRDPSVNLSLNEFSGQVGVTHTHYGVQVKSVEELQQAGERLQGASIPVRFEEETTCCYARQSKLWATDPDGNDWEVFVVLDADVDELPVDSTCCDRGADTGCC